MTDHGDPLRIKSAIRDQVINGSLQPPCPGGNRAPIAVGKLRPNSFRGVWPVRLDIAVVKRREGVAAIDGLVNRPNVDLFASTRFGGVVVRASWRSAGHPTCRRWDQGIIDYHVIAVKVQSEKHGRRFGTRVWRDDEQMDRRVFLPGQVNGHLLKGGLAIKNSSVHALDDGARF